MSSFNLYSYCLRVDDGAAPNPYGGILTLAICKPAIRRTAKLEDWIIGHGSVNSPVGDTSKKIIYVMKITKILTMKEYDSYCKKEIKIKIPKMKSNEYYERVGDCIYYYTNSKPRIRNSVHNKYNMKPDLSGKNVLLSDYFFYFGDKSIDIPSKYLSILHPNQGHKKKKNDKIKNQFIQWLQNNFKGKENTILGEPEYRKKMELNFADQMISNYCDRLAYDLLDEEL